MISNRVCGITLIAVSATICSTPSGIAASFDGNWSVVAQTTQGHCGSMQFGLAISHGRLYSPGGYYVFGYPAQLGGRVSPSGNVQAIGVAGPRTANVVGRLRQFQGNGTWAGSGPSGVCSGIWNAARLRQTFLPATLNFSASGHSATPSRIQIAKTTADAESLGRPH